MVFTFTGPSAGGKTRIVHYLAKRYPDVFSVVITSTTRKPRLHEIDGYDYSFESYPREGFFEWSGLHVASIEFGNQLYGIPAASAYSLLHPKTVHSLIVTDWKGALELKEMFPNVRNVYIKAKPKTVKNRLKRRCADGLERRKLDVAWGLCDSTKIPYDFILLNHGNFKNVVKPLVSYIEKTTENLAQGGAL